MNSEFFFIYLLQFNGRVYINGVREKKENYHKDGTYWLPISMYFVFLTFNVKLVKLFAVNHDLNWFQINFMMNFSHPAPQKLQWACAECQL